MRESVSEYCQDNSEQNNDHPKKKLTSNRRDLAQHRITTARTRKTGSKQSRYPLPFETVLLVAGRTSV